MLINGPDYIIGPIYFSLRPQLPKRPKNRNPVKKIKFWNIDTKVWVDFRQKSIGFHIPERESLKPVLAYSWDLAEKTAWTLWKEDAILFATFKFSSCLMSFKYLHLFLRPLYKHYKKQFFIWNITFFCSRIGFLLPSNALLFYFDILYLMYQEFHNIDFKNLENDWGD